MAELFGDGEDVILDAAGERLAIKRTEKRHEQMMEQLRANRDRLVKAAGKIPVLETVEEVVAHATPVPGYAYGESLSFPALQLGPDLDSFEVFAALPQHYGARPNAVAEYTDQRNVGPHFDAYAGSYLPWTLHEEIEGAGIIWATFVPEHLYRGYKEFARALPADHSEVGELLANNRSMLGRIAMRDADPESVFTGEVRPGTRTLLWHGDRGTTPSVHDIHREGPGSYRIYGHHLGRGPLGVGFQAFEPDTRVVE